MCIRDRISIANKISTRTYLIGLAIVVFLLIALLAFKLIYRHDKIFYEDGSLAYKGDHVDGNLATIEGWDNIDSNRIPHGTGTKYFKTCLLYTSRCV